VNVTSFGKATHTPITPGSRDRLEPYRRGLIAGLIIGGFLIAAIWGASELLK
jgi:hypothetical protein